MTRMWPHRKKKRSWKVKGQSDQRLLYEKNPNVYISGISTQKSFQIFTYASLDDPLLEYKIESWIWFNLHNSGSISATMA